MSDPERFEYTSVTAQAGEAGLFTPATADPDLQESIGQRLGVA